VELIAGGVGGFHDLVDEGGEIGVVRGRGLGLAEELRHLGGGVAAGSGEGHGESGGDAEGREDEIGVAGLSEAAVEVGGELVETGDGAGCHAGEGGGQE
jgi:hypothetical protein